MNDSQTSHVSCTSLTPPKKPLPPKPPNPTHHCFWSQYFNNFVELPEWRSAFPRPWSSTVIAVLVHVIGSCLFLSVFPFAFCFLSSRHTFSRHDCSTWEGYAFPRTPSASIHLSFSDTNSQREEKRTETIPLLLIPESAPSICVKRISQSLIIFSFCFVD